MRPVDIVPPLLAPSPAEPHRGVLPHLLAPLAPRVQRAGAVPARPLCAAARGGQAAALLLPGLWRRPARLHGEPATCWLGALGSPGLDLCSKLPHRPTTTFHHACLPHVQGQNFAYLQIKTIWSVLLRNFDFEMIDPVGGAPRAHSIGGPRACARPT